jgi:hypothetical protein
VAVSTTISIPIPVALVLARLGLDDRDLDFFFVFFPFFDVKAVVLDLLVHRALWVKHEPQGPAALGYRVYWQSRTDLLRRLNELWGRDGSGMPIRHA